MLYLGAMYCDSTKMYDDKKKKYTTHCIRTNREEAAKCFKRVIDSNDPSLTKRAAPYYDPQTNTVPANAPFYKMIYQVRRTLHTLGDSDSELPRYGLFDVP